MGMIFHGPDEDEIEREAREHDGEGKVRPFYQSSFGRPVRTSLTENDVKRIVRETLEKELRKK